ncbi:uncharacterized protein LOC132737625 [Ruditapes philippinarum]|uniref:uncharacterized protein LOC132737625 n=1 Tax=Ruditapes philippinarum TaxID=129788 RepID=UPI00295A573D|nr:uncharacterized protein LOC132737625 [Ruditapes philippinarum]
MINYSHCKSVAVLVFLALTPAHSVEKRILLEGNALEELHSVISEVEHLKTKLSSLETQLQQTDSGSSYVRWGRSSCPADNELVYKGYGAGSDYRVTGGAANWLCLSEQPQWGYYEDNIASGAQIYGAEYEFSDFHYNGGSKYFKQNLNDEDAPCSFCRSPRSSVAMFPGRLECFSGWTKEYSGYLVSGAHHHTSASEYICLDSDAEMLAGGVANTDGRVIYLVEGICGTLKCPPYVQGRELTCVVCSK